eukprot:scaffold6456_cov98-Isochrysis_galbana.AAC.11
MDLAATPVTKLINGDAFYLHRSTHGDFGLFIQGEEWTNDPVGPLFEPFGGDWLLSLSLLAGARRIALAARASSAYRPRCTEVSSWVLECEYKISGGQVPSLQQRAV